MTSVHSVVDTGARDGSGERGERRTPAEGARRQGAVGGAGGAAPGGQDEPGNSAETEHPPDGRGKGVARRHMTCI